MTPSPRQHDDARLEQDIRDAHDLPPIETGGLDDSILAAAREHFAGSSPQVAPTHRIKSWQFKGLAAAAGLAIASGAVLVALLTTPNQGPASSPSQPSKPGLAQADGSLDPQDFNADGLVDVLDLLAAHRAGDPSAALLSARIVSLGTLDQGGAG